MTITRRLRQISRPARHAFAFLILRVLVVGFRILPLRVALALGSTLGRLIGLLARSDTRQMQFGLALLDAPPTSSACWADLGRRFVEFICARKVMPHIEIRGLEAAQAALGAGQGALVATLHLGNWELMAAALSAQGLPVASVVSRSKNSPLHRWLALERARLGVRALPPGGGARKALGILRSGGVVGLFVDQNTGARTQAVDFMGYTAPTATIWPRLLALSGAQPWLAWTARLPDGSHQVTLEPAPQDLQALTNRLEALIRSHPEQWVWLHDRWGRKSVMVPS